MSATAVEGLGSVTWWGFSPALDLANIGSVRNPVDTSLADIAIQSDHVNVLLVGSGDLRHVLTTLANASGHTSRPLHFYIAEGSLEVLARHMLFLALTFEPADKLGLQEKAELFLELFGNSLVRAHTAEYLREKATDLIKMVTDLDYLRSCIPVLDISLLKFKERDMLEGIFKFWRHPGDSTFDLKRHWDGRLRQYLGTRYDARSGVFDWDYHMKLQEMAPVVGSREYTEWREGGVAFHLRDDAPYQTTNRTLASGVIVTQAGGERAARRGYWGDLVNSPFLAFGIESENKELFKTVNGKHVNTSAGVSEYNLLSLMHTLTTGKKYTGHPSSGRARNVGVIEELFDEDEAVSGEQKPLGSEEKANGHSSGGALFNGSHRITFLPLGSVAEMGKKAKFRKFFNVVYFSNSMVHNLTGGIESTMAPNCTLVLETAKYMMELNKEQRGQYVKKVTVMAASLGFKVALHSSEDRNYLAFINEVS